MKFPNYHLHLVKHAENLYAVHLDIDSKNIFGYCTGYVSMPLYTWKHFLNAVIPKVKFPRYDVVTIFRSSALFFETESPFCGTCHYLLRNISLFFEKWGRILAT